MIKAVIAGTEEVKKEIGFPKLVWSKGRDGIIEVHKKPNGGYIGIHRTGSCKGAIGWDFDYGSHNEDCLESLIIQNTF